MLRCKRIHTASCYGTAGKADSDSSACRFPNNSTLQPTKPLRHKPLPSSWKGTRSFRNASPSVGHSSSSRHQHIPPRTSSPSALGTQGLCWGASRRRARQAGRWDKMLATGGVTAGGAVSSSNAARGSACSTDHSTNSFITQHMFSFIKSKKKKKRKQKLYFFCNKKSNRAIETESRREILQRFTSGSGMDGMDGWKPGRAWLFLPRSQGTRKLEKALSCAAGSCLLGATSSTIPALGEGPSPSRKCLRAMSRRIFSQAMM